MKIREPKDKLPTDMMIIKMTPGVFIVVLFPKKVCPPTNIKHQSQTGRPESHTISFQTFIRIEL